MKGSIVIARVRVKQVQRGPVLQVRSSLLSFGYELRTYNPGPRYFANYGQEQTESCHLTILKMAGFSSGDILTSELRFALYDPYFFAT